jgi:hypothetical protein
MRSDMLRLACHDLLRIEAHKADLVYAQVLVRGLRYITRGNAAADQTCAPENDSVLQIHV